MTGLSPRAQVGVGTFVVLVVMVFVASIAAGVLVNTTSVASVGPAVGSSGDGTGVSNGLVVVGQTGTAVTEYGVGRVNLTVSAGSDAGPIDLRETTLTWVGPTGSYNVAHERATGATGDARFAVYSRSDPNDSLPVLDSRADRVVLSLDLGGDDVAAVGEFGQRLGPGDQAIAILTTSGGSTTRIRLAAPRSLGSGRAVVL